MTFIDHDLSNLIDRMERLDGAGIKTGIQEGSEHLQKALWTEYGTSDGHIEERPVVSVFGDTHRAELQQLSKKVAKATVVQKKDPKAALDDMGEQVEDKLRQALIDYDEKPNMPATVAKKGFDDPWYQTGDTIEDVQYKLDGI